ncbi:DUF898 domain-containing protein [Amylibacter sp. SFDW26]|uniref:YjgN family protein n=1 Tax=Amylibacter sp. SFDW26 TaxID=2652722 RepID=UPI001261A2B1|nr:YjgN family protein [Amylibacter sp. SFDW26]KAB7613917.1 DUF898 domain-containing protein [Amylibacter sp. SFDW26]
MSENAIEKFKFTGNAKEWFGIWIVNLLLSIITIGIYSAWAKVRAKKYFSNHTYVSDRNFDYHATGKQILIGRLIVIGGYILFNIVLIAVPFLGLFLLLALIGLMPWLIVRSMMFNARMTSFSNVRFNFVGTVGKAFLVFFIYPILTALTAYTTAPFLSRAVRKFSINNHRLGTAEFHFDGPIGPFYKAFLVAIAWVVIVGGLGMLATGFNILELAYAMDNLETDPSTAGSIIGMFYLLLFVAVLPAAMIYFAMIRNTVYNATTLTGGHKFNSTVSAGKMLWIALSSFVVVVCTLGLMIPWAQVRMSKYLAENTDLIPGGSLDDFIGTQQAEASALGDAFTDLEGIDVGLPV